jgi:hypothetical protein
LDLGGGHHVDTVMGILIVGLSVWIIHALATGRTLWLSRTSMPRIVSRGVDPIGYWGMVVANSAILAFTIALTIWPQISK